MYWRFHILIIVLALTIQTTTGVRCYKCTYNQKERFCLNPKSYLLSEVTFGECKGTCGVVLGFYGNIGHKYKAYPITIMERNCGKSCDKKKKHCCTCDFDYCNGDNFCGTALILSPTSLYVIGGFFLMTMCVFA